MRRRYLASLTLVLSALALTLVPSSAFAQTTDSVSGDALRISPVRTDLTINPGNKKTVDVSITNITKSPASLRGIVSDFGAANDETGKPKIYLDENSYAPSHGLKRYVQDIGTFQLKPNETKTVKVNITIPSDAAGGGYFGVVRFTPTDTSGQKSVNLSGSVGSLLLVTVPGDVKEQLGVVSFNVNRQGGKASNLLTHGNGLQAAIRLKNSGNVQVQPFGKLVLRKSDKILNTIEINNTTPRGSVLPDSIRRFDVPLGDKALGFGHYQLDGNFGFGTKGQLITASTSFWVVPLPFLIGLLVLLLLIVAAIVAIPRMLKSHDRKLLRRIRSRGKR